MIAQVSSFVSLFFFFSLFYFIYQKRKIWEKGECVSNFPNFRLCNIFPSDHTHTFPLLLTALQKLEEEVEDARQSSAINFTIHLIYKQAIYGVRATVSLCFPLSSSPPKIYSQFLHQIFWKLGISTLALQCARKFLDNTQCIEWRFNITFGKFKLFGTMIHTY